VSVAWGQRAGKILAARHGVNTSLSDRHEIAADPHRTRPSPVETPPVSAAIFVGKEGVIRKAAP